MDIWLSGLSNDPTDPFGADLFATTDRQLAYSWLVASMIEWGPESEPYLDSVKKSLADPTSAGAVVAWMDDETGVETRAFVMQVPVMGEI